MQIYVFFWGISLIIAHCLGVGNFFEPCNFNLLICFFGDIDDEHILCFWAKVTEVVLPPYILFIICFLA